ncbi:MAG: Fpg/Nei family DNA glycosylase [Microbacteriaceae bacterium]|nr:Fpg/Nei family DNA glycosylase [Microbacteriaceae bacterium]
MPEGHSVHRIARQFESNFVGRRVAASSPQGRFAEGAARLDGREMAECFAVGKQMFARFDGGVWLRVHLGIYGAWDFSGEVSTKLGQTGEYSRLLPARPDGVVDLLGEDSVRSIGAPRRMRMAEEERADELEGAWPPEPVGAVRLRLLTDVTCADLRGPTACEALDAAGVDRVLDRLGPDPLVVDPEAGEQAFVDNAGRRRVAIGQLLMDQSVVAGIGNIYRAEMLYRAGLSPHVPGNEVDEATLRELWRDWTKLLQIGVDVGQMMTIDGLTGDEWDLALRDRDHRHWVYGRAGEPCRRCGTPIALEMMQNRKLYWCPGCQR